MLATDRSYFLKMVRHLRKNEEVMLYENILAIPDEEVTSVAEFLRSEYENEALNHPKPLPEYDPEAAVWAARTLYVSAQLLLYRENKVTDLSTLIPDNLEVNAGAILSADLTLRFLPDLVKQMEVIDPDDDLLHILRKLLEKWHYSAVSYTKIFNHSISRLWSPMRVYINCIAIELFKTRSLHWQYILYLGNGLPLTLECLAKTFGKNLSIIILHTLHEQHR
jgi:hypothetical protein